MRRKVNEYNRSLSTVKGKEPVEYHISHSVDASHGLTSREHLEEKLLRMNSVLNDIMPVKKTRKKSTKEELENYKAIKQM